jgi:hypothetical protein
MKAYVYTHTRLDTNEVFYVGISTQKNFKRAYHLHERSNYWHNIAKKCGLKVSIIFDDLTWEEACIKEKELILKYGRIDLGTGTLVNLTNGGDGNIGGKASEETKVKMSIAKKGVKKSKEHIENMKKALVGNNSKKIIDTKTGVIYNSITEAAYKNGISRNNLSSYLTRNVTNKTTLEYYRK